MQALARVSATKLTCKFNDDERWILMNNLIRSILKTAVYFLDQTNSFTSDVRDRVSDSVGRVSDRVSDLREQAEDLYSDDDHTVRNVLTFVAGVGVGVGAALLFAPASGEEIRGQIGDKVQDIGDRVRERFSSRPSTGTEGH
jgi:gas vesicle protein